MFTDVIVRHKDGKVEIKAHKLILAVHSPVLSDLLFGKYSSDQFIVDDVDIEAMKNMLRFFYCEELVLKSLFNIKETKKISDRYQIIELGNICKKKICSLAVDVCNVITVLQTAIEFGNEAKEKECLTLISENRETVFTSQPFTELEIDNGLEIFEKLRDMGSLTEEEFLRSALKWLESKNDVMNNTGKLKEKVTVSKLCMEEFHDIVISFPEFFNNIEISKALKEIKSLRDIQMESQKNIDVGVNTEVMKDEIGETKNVRDEPQKLEAGNIDVISDTSIKHPVHVLKDENAETENVIDGPQKLEAGNIDVISDTSIKQAVHVLKDENAETENVRDEPQKLEAGNIDAISGISIKQAVHALKDENAETENVTDEPPKLETGNMDVINEAVIEQDSGFKRNKSLLIVCILNDDTDDSAKTARITVEDEIGSRSLQFLVVGTFANGIFKSLSAKDGEQKYPDIDISYEGIYFMLQCLGNEDVDISPMNYLEVLKASMYFMFRYLVDSCIMKIGNICEDDPLYLDSLRYFNYFEDLCVDHLRKRTFAVILHPNFINCSIQLISLLLDQSELTIYSEAQLLFVTITWLEARNRLRWEYRDWLLNKIAFQNISFSNFEYAIRFYPKTFTDNEINTIRSLKSDIDERCSSVVATQVCTNDNSLPEWYSFKSRNYLEQEAFANI